MSYDMNSFLLYGVKGFIKIAQSLHEQFTSVKGPRTDYALAQQLLNVYSILKIKENVSERGPKNELMYLDSFMGLIPWTDEKATSLEKIYPFLIKNIDKWYQTPEVVDLYKSAMV